MDGAFWEGSQEGWGPAARLWLLPAVPIGDTARLLSPFQGDVLGSLK